MKVLGIDRSVCIEVVRLLCWKIIGLLALTLAVIVPNGTGSPEKLLML